MRVLLASEFENGAAGVTKEASLSLFIGG
jgi:hypothetical protein